ncbi:hypothetical protein, partial [Achromobacter mucicolens]|uniref:hypothetical protein n=1 Tax=Achromobacter mucicolens TaxID=1389922 RepID=UPI00197AB7B2
MNDGSLNTRAWMGVRYLTTIKYPVTSAQRHRHDARHPNAKEGRPRGRFWRPRKIFRPTPP